MIVVDGRTDEEKLRELIAAGAEETCLDFKRTLHLGDKVTKATLDFVKDCVAMMNQPHGGYLVVGVNDDGSPAHEHERVDVSRFDSADLRGRVAKYVEAPITIFSAKHVLDQREVVLIYVGPNPDGLPVPFASLGEYDLGNGKMRSIFREGEVTFREGTSNVTLRYSHWDQLLEKYRGRIRAQARADADDLIAKVIAALGDGGASDERGSTRLLPLVAGMEWHAFEEALLTHLESPSTLRLQQFVEATAVEVVDNFPDGSHPDATSQERYHQSLDALAVTAILAARYRRADAYDLAVSALREVYEASGKAPVTDSGEIGSNASATKHWLEVIERVCLVGRYVTGLARYDLLPRLVYRPVRVHSNYVYETWIRHAHVGASRRELLAPEGRRGGNLLSYLRAAVVTKAWLRPDVPNAEGLEPGTEIPANDVLTNTLAQFDFWWCVMAAAGRSGSTGRAFYPSCAALHQHRTQPAIDTIARDEAARRAAFPEASDYEVAKAMSEVLTLAVRESINYGGFWSGVDPRSPAEFFLASQAVPVVLNFE